MSQVHPVLLDIPSTLWDCPNCDYRDRTRESGPHTRYHRCRGLGGLSTPMTALPPGSKKFDDRKEKRAKVEAKLREDYVGSEKVQTDENGRPVMSIVTTRDDGNDVVVLAPVAESRS